MLDVASVTAEQQPTALWAASALLALAREEASGRRPRRLLEAELATWSRFRGRLGPAALLELLFEDAAVTQPEPFATPSAIGSPRPVSRLPEDVIEGWLNQVGNLDLTAPASEYITAQAKFLGLPSRMAKAELHRMRPHHKVLEVPGTGGQLAHHILVTQPELHLRDSFIIACATWQERTLAGLVAVDRGASGDLPILLDPKLEAARTRGPFDYVVGLAPEKGGAFAKSALQSLFPSATVLLV